MEYTLKIEFSLEHIDNKLYDEFDGAVHKLFSNAPNQKGIGSGTGFGMRDIEVYFDDRDVLDQVYLSLIDLVHTHGIFDYEISANQTHNNQLH